MIADDFLSYSGAKLRQFLDRIELCLEKLTKDQIWARGHENENSIGNLCLHLRGNVKQWIFSGVDGEPDERDRDAEFAEREGGTRQELAAGLRLTVLEACARIEALPADRLEESIEVQGYNMTVLQAVYHVVEHFAQHTGQIVFATKMLTGEELGFYRHLRGKQKSHSERTP